MVLIRNTFLHFKKICTHKFWVFYYACKLGIPWRGLVHDLSKFSPIEFWEGVKYYDGKRSPIDKCKEQNGYSKAWLHHKGRNKHHYHYWTDYFDEGMKPVCMPFVYTLEMLADFLGAARAYMGGDFSYEKEYEWWINKRSSKSIHPVQKVFINISLIYAKNHACLMNKSSLKKLYNMLIEYGTFEIGG